jgi:hypothetical protein
MHNLISVYFVKNLYMLRAYLQPISRRYTVRIQQLVLTVLFRWLSVVLAGQPENSKYQLLYLYGVPPDDGL